jgi:hypothetical protein
MHFLNHPGIVTVDCSAPGQLRSSYRNPPRSSSHSCSSEEDHRSWHLFVLSRQWPGLDCRCRANHSRRLGTNRQFETSIGRKPNCKIMPSLLQHTYSLPVTREIESWVDPHELKPYVDVAHRHALSTLRPHAATGGCFASPKPYR